MSLEPLPTVDPDLPALLRALQEQLAAGDQAGRDRTLQAIGEERLAAVPTLVGALCMGGLGFASELLAARPGGQAACSKLAVVDAFTVLVEAPPGSPPDHERRVAEWLIDAFGLQADPASLLDLARVEILISEAPLAELPEAVLAAMRHRNWELALRGLERMQASLGQGTPRNAYGLAAMCLHKLGRYVEADAWVMQGLGPEAALLAIGPVASEAELLSRWGPYETPTISIVCTAYNHERYVDSTIRGFLSQDCPYPFEILIHDDASTDRTQDVIRRWQADYPTLIRPLLQTENQFSRGVRPFELLLARARGEYVATCEGDDFWVDPAKLRRQVGYLQRHPDFSCSAHNYYHFFESTLSVKPWTRLGRDFILGQRQLMNVHALLWLPTLVFRRTFSALPPERDLAAIGDQFLTSFLGTLGRCAYFETMLGAVRRENEFSIWSPLPQREKERRRVTTWAALARMHERLGNHQAVADLQAKIAASSLDEAARTTILDAVGAPQRRTLEAA